MAKIKFAQRLIRGTVYGFILGFTLGLIGYLVGTAVNAFGSTSVNNTAFMLFGMAVGFGAPIAMEISRDMEEQ